MKAVFIILFTYVCILSYSQNQRGFQVLFTHENDVLSPLNKDENYTGAFKLEVLYPQKKRNYLPFYTFKGKGTKNINKIAIGGTGYTPQEIGDSAIQFGDRPFASVIFLSIGKNSFDTSGKTQLNSELYIGKMGLDEPGALQANIHRNHLAGSTRPEPQGWHNQIGYNQNAYIINYNVGIKKSIWHSNSIASNRIIKKLKTKENLTLKENAFLKGIGHDELNYKAIEDELWKNKKFEWIQTYWTGELAVGNYMLNAQVGAMINLFNFNTSHLLNYDPQIIKLTVDTASGVKKRKGIKYIRTNLFLQPIMRIVGYNTTLEGLMINDNSIYKINHGDVNRIVFDLNGGINLMIIDRFYLRYNMSVRTQEYKNGKDLHLWGAASIGFSPAKWNKTNL